MGFVVRIFSKMSPWKLLPALVILSVVSEITAHVQHVQITTTTTRKRIRITRPPHHPRPHRHKNHPPPHNRPPHPPPHHAGGPAPVPGPSSSQQTNVVVNIVNNNQQSTAQQVNNYHESDSVSREDSKGPRKAFIQPKAPFQWDPGHVQDSVGELPPTEDVKNLVHKQGGSIKIRAQLPVITDEDKADLNVATVEPIGYIHHQEGESEVYFIRVIIGSEYIVHVKITAPRIADYATPGAFKPDIENSVLMVVLPDKGELDKLSKEEFDRTHK